MDYWKKLTNKKPYIIAEIGVNHGGSLAKAKEMIKSAYDSGASAAKFQTYKASTLASKDSPSYWDLSEENTTSQFELFSKYDTFGKEQYIELKNYCDLIGIDFLSTPFDLESVDYLSQLMPFFKIASADITNVPLIKKCCQYGKPIVASTGASSMKEIEDLVNLVKSYNVPLALLHCVLLYPTPIENANLSFISTLKSRFSDIVIGYSDHVKVQLGTQACEIALSLGARIIEKHYTYDKSLTGNDHYHAMDQTDLLLMSKNFKMIDTMLGNGKKNLSLESKAISNARRSLYTKGNVKAGQILTTENIIAKRPGKGISPKDLDGLLGKTFNQNLMDDTAISMDHFE